MKLKVTTIHIVETDEFEDVASFEDQFDKFDGDIMRMVTCKMVDLCDYEEQIEEIEEFDDEE